MEVLATRDDAAIARAIAAAGHRVRSWAFEAPGEAHVAIVYGLAEAKRALAAPVHVLAIVEPGEVDGLPAAKVTDFALAGATVAEIVARVTRICAQPAWSLEQLHKLMVSEHTAHLPVVMLTMMQQRDVGQALGAVDYLFKPLDPDTLVTTLRRHVKSAGARILVVEDDEPTRDVITRTLTAAGHRVATAANGQLALDALPDLAPDVIILDLTMPVMDGFEFLHHLRTGARHAGIPVIVATARTLSEDERRRLVASAQHVIEKHAHTRAELLDLIAAQIRSMVKV